MGIVQVRVISFVVIVEVHLGWHTDVKTTRRAPGSGHNFQQRDKHTVYDEPPLSRTTTALCHSPVTHIGKGENNQNAHKNANGWWPTSNRGLRSDAPSHRAKQASPATQRSSATTTTSPLAEQPIICHKQTNKQEMFHCNGYKSASQEKSNNNDHTESNVYVQNKFFSGH